MGKKIDLTGERFGRLNVLSEVPERDGNKKVLWNCLCDCGKQIQVVGGALKSGNTKSCGCITTAIDLEGQRFGLWTVIEDSGKKDIGGAVLWTCVCNCGERRDVSSNSLRRGKSTSCGCVRNEDLTGEKFGRLEVMRLADNRRRGNKAWLCQCSCGNKINVITNELKSGHVISCGCARGSRLDLRGYKFGRLTVTRDTGKRLFRSPIWECLCDCGTKKEATVNNLRGGTVKSCGCLRADNVGENAYNYNPNLTPEERLKKRYVLSGGYSRTWSKEIMKRDDYTCQTCKKRGGELNAHHIYAWNKYPEQRFEIDNGVTLCVDCHKEFHKMYGRGGNTFDQFKEYVSNKTFITN